MDEKILNLEHISAEYRTDDGVSSVLNDISFSLNKGETLGLVGETGAGKTTTALAIMGLLPKRTGYITVSYTHLLENKVWSQMLKGKNYREIAFCLRRSTKTVDNAIQRIKKKIQQFLEN